MRKILTLLSISALVALSSCKKEETVDPNPWGKEERKYAFGYVLGASECENIPFYGDTLGQTVWTDSKSNIQVVSAAATNNADCDKLSSSSLQKPMRVQIEYTMKYRKDPVDYQWTQNGGLLPIYEGELVRSKIYKVY